MPVISKWKFERCTTSRQPEGSNFKPYPFFNWTQDKCSCITLDIITKADFFQKLIYPPFNVTVVALNTYLCPEALLHQLKPQSPVYPLTRAMVDDA